MELNIHHQEIRILQQTNPNHPDIDSRLNTINDILGWLSHNQVKVKLNPENDKYEEDN